MPDDKGVLRQLRRAAPVLAVAYAAAAGLLLLIVVLRVLGVVGDFGEITRDPIHRTGVHPFVGFLSNTGVLFWSAAAAISFFCAAVLRGREDGRGDASFYFWTGILTAYLTLDDLFLFHDVVFREDLNVNEWITYSVYLAVVAAFVYGYRMKIRRTDYAVLVLAALFFGLSVFVDLITDIGWIPGAYLFEDGFKFLGIISWLMYLVLAGYTDVRRRQGDRS